MTKRNHIREVIAKNRGNQAVFKRRKEDKAIVKAELRSLNAVQLSLKEQIKGVVLQFGSNDKLLQVAYNQVDILK